MSAPSAALGLVIGLSGCIIETDDGWHPHHECSVDARTSGAYDGRVTAIDGCTLNLTRITSADTAPEQTRSFGVLPKDAFPFEHLELSVFGPLAEEGEGIAAKIIVTTSDGVSWVTPDGACTANYTSKTCDDDDGDAPGRQYIVEGVECNDPAAAEGKQDLLFEDFLITSTCEPEGKWQFE
jgi:hypothetical protein